MRKKLDMLLLVFASVAFGSCSKFSNGPVIPEERHRGPFQIIEICDNVDVNLKHCDNANHPGDITIKTKKNLMENIGTDTTEVEIKAPYNGDTITYHFTKLKITNNNTLNFLRPYDYKLEMTVYYDSLYELIFNSNATVTTDTLRGYNYPTHFSSVEGSDYDSLTPNLVLDIEGGSGDFQIKTHCYRLITKYIHGTSNLTFCGQANRIETWADYDCHGIIDGFNAEALDYHQITNLGTNMVIAKAFKRINGLNDNIGHIYYLRYKKTLPVAHSIYNDHGHWIGTQIEDSTYHCPLDVSKAGAYKENITSVTEHPIPGHQ